MIPLVRRCLASPVRVRMALVVLRVLVVLMVLVVPLGGCGTSTSGDGSAAVTVPLVERFLDATRAQRYDEVAAMMHPEAITEFHTALMTLVDQATMEGQVEELLPLFPGSETVDDIRALSPEAFFAAVYRGMVDMMPQVGEAMAGAGMKVIGSLDEDLETAHVLYRLDLDLMGDKVSRVEIVTLKRYQGEWRIYLAGELQDFMKMLGT